MLTTISPRMLKWFRRDKNDPQGAIAPAADQPGAPAAPNPDAAPIGDDASAKAADRPADAAVPTDASSAPAEAPAVDAVLVATAAAPAAEAATPWWRYEGVWRAPKASPSPAAAAPAQTSATGAQPEPPVVPAPEAPMAGVPEPVATAGGDTDDVVPSMFATAEATAEALKPRSLRERLAATARALTASVGSLFKRNPKLDEDLLEELETALIQADVGVTASTELVAKLGARMRKREFADAQALLAALRADLRALVVNHARPLHIPAAPRPFVILTVGVNGAGKTTTIGKLAMRYKQAGHSVMLAAGDTFRAAAVEQLRTWGERNQVAVVAQGSGADSASVIFDALQAAKSRGIDVLIADTAGRLHTQGHLMQELAKVKRVLGKIDPEAPHETLLVIDGGTGQNALNQARQFHQAVGLTGIAVTKLDGTAKGGMVFALCRELGLPIRFIGVGEKREDLREFVADDFVDALLPRELGG